MTRTVLRCVLALIFVFLTTKTVPVHAQLGDSAYVVRDVQVDTLAESSVKARNKAFLEAQVKAFAILSQRFGEAGQVKSPEPKILAGMVQDFEVTNEQLSTKRYRGTYVFRFKAGAANRYFGHGPVSGFSEETARGGTLILPFYQDGTKTVLWDTAKNPWLKAWLDAKTGDSSYIVPLGDVSDMMDIHDDQALTIGAAALKRIKSRYGASDVLVTVARLDRSKSEPLDILLFGFSKGEQSLRQTIQIPVKTPVRSVDLFGQALRLTHQAIENGLPAPLSGETELSSSPSPSPSPSSPPSSPSVSPSLVASPPVPVAVTPPPAAVTGGTFHARVVFANMGEWLTLRRDLGSVSAIQNLRITTMKTSEAEMDISYADREALIKALSGKGLSLYESAPGRFQIIRRAPLTSYPFRR
jgi:hypothetical protein